MELLPFEMKGKILNYLTTHDLNNWRSVCKEFNFLAKNYVKMRSDLAIKTRNHIKEEAVCCFFDFQSIELGNCLFVQHASFESSPFMASALRQVREFSIHFDDAGVLIDLVNTMTGLEKLKIHSLHATTYEEFELRLPNLQLLSVQAFADRLKLNTPKLYAFEANCEIQMGFHFIYPQNITHLSARSYKSHWRTIFPKLRCLYIWELESVVSRSTLSVPESVLKMFPDLQELHAFHQVQKQRASQILSRKTRNNRPDFKFYYHGIGFDSSDLWLAFAKNVKQDDKLVLDTKFSFQLVLDNYTRLAPLLPTIIHVDYNDLVTFFDGQIDESEFFGRFVNVRSVSVSGKLDDLEQLIRFVGRCNKLTSLKLEDTCLNEVNGRGQLPRLAQKCLQITELELINTGLARTDFFEYLHHLQLTESTTENLTIMEKTQLDLEFILKLKKLRFLKIDQPISYSQILTALQELPCFEVLEFAPGGKRTTPDTRIRISARLLNVIRSSSTDKSVVRFGTRAEWLDYIQKQLYYWYQS